MKIRDKFCSCPHKNYNNSESCRPLQVRWFFSLTKSIDYLYHNGSSHAYFCVIETGENLYQRESNNYVARYKNENSHVCFVKIES